MAQSSSPNQVSVTLATSHMARRMPCRPPRRALRGCLSVAAVYISFRAMAVDARDGDLEPRECCEC